MAEENKPLVLIVSGPSGSGKSTLVEKILELPGTLLSVSYTTRPPRKTESAGKWYNFISEEQFQQMIARGEFLEYAQVFGRHWYGTPSRPARYCIMRARPDSGSKAGSCARSSRIPERSRPIRL